MLTSPRRILSWIRHAPDRWLHALRRRRAVRHLSGIVPRTVLVVCLGNICRSPYAEHALRRRLEGLSRTPPQVRSAGFLESGRPPPDEALQASAERGYDLTAHRSSSLTPQEVGRSDLLVVMEPGQARELERFYPHARGRTLVLGDLDPEPIRKRAIPDPVNRPVADFREVYARIDRCVDAMVGPLSSSG